MKIFREISKEEQNKLKDCPFCGDSDIKRYRNGNSHFLYCDFCKASTQKFSIITAEEVVNKYWNRRVIEIENIIL